MANTIAGVALAKLAQETLDLLMPQMQPLMAFTTDLSAEVQNDGASITTRFVSQPTTVDFASGYTAQDQTITAKTITLGAVKGTCVGFTDKEYSTSSIGDLRRLFVEPSANAVAQDVLATVLALVTNANFSANSTIASSALDADAVAGLSQKLSEAKVPRAGRFAYLSPAYATTLRKDIAQFQIYGSASPLIDGVVPRIHGLDVYEYNGTIPDNSENLAGFVGGKQGIILAMRQPAAPQDFPGQVATATDPSGVSIQVRMWYSADEGKHKLSCGALWGAAVGVAGNIVRIKSS